MAESLAGRRVIVLDEQLRNADILEQIAGWYRGRVLPITALRPGTVIKDDAIPLLLRRVRDATFVTINTRDFWRRIAAEKSYCVTCFLLPDERADEISGLLRRLFHLTEFKTKRTRQGKVVLVNDTQVRYYQVGDSQVVTLVWSEHEGL